MFFWGRYIIVWTIWVVFADKTRWRELFSIAIYASLLGMITDHLLSDYYVLWSYNGQPKIIKQVLDDIGIYIVTTYLFIQWLPKKKKLISLLFYWFIWTAIAVGIEWLHLVLDKMNHHKWWSLWFSYMSDWFLLWVFYKVHQIFKYEKLPKVK